MFSWLTQSLVYKFIKFGIVGLSGVLVDFGITFVCKEWLIIPKYISNTIGFIIAATTNYYLNRVWTFYSHNANVLREFSEFFVISIIGLTINTLILYLLINRLKLNFYLAKLFAIGVTTIWNFSANYLYTFAT